MPKHNPEKLTKVKIEVTARLVKTGTPNDIFDCPVARALKKVLTKKVELEANYEDITLALPWNPIEDGDDDQFQQIATPAKVSKFMERFDAFDPDCDGNYDEDGNLIVELPPPPKPFSFILRIQNKFLRPGLRS